MHPSLIFFTVTLAFVASTLAVEAPNPVEAKLRDGLKNTMLQLRTVQGEKAALEAEKAELEAKVAELTEKVDKLEKQSTDDKAAADKRIAEQVERLVERGNAVTKLETDLAASQKAHKEAAALAAKKEAERAKVNSDKIVLERKVADQQTKNAELYKLGSEILTRYEKFGLGTAIVAREPFVGLTRVKLQNLIQDYGDKLADQKIKP
jgi:septal ring factor EnvC (AmiA/AmiB activator)